MVYDQREELYRRRQAEKQKFSSFRGDKPKKPKAWSHQDELKSLIGRSIRVRRAADADVIRGILEAADQFTLKIRIPNESKPVVFFKSALIDFGEA